MIYTDIDKEILYWTEQFGYEPINIEELINYIKENWIDEQRTVVEKFVEAMEIKVPNLEILDWNKICEIDNDYEALGGKKYLNIYELEQNDIELKRMNLIK